VGITNEPGPELILKKVKITPRQTLAYYEYL